MLKPNNSKQSYADKFQKRNEIIKTSSNSKSSTPAKTVKGSPRTDNISSVNKSSADNNSGNVTQFIAFDSIKDVNNGDNANNSKINNRFDDASSSSKQSDVEYMVRKPSQSNNEDVLSQKSDLSESFNEDDDEEDYDNDDYAGQQKAQGGYNNRDYIVHSSTNTQPQSSNQQPYVYPDRQVQQQPLPTPTLPSNQQKIASRQQHPPALPAAQYRSEQQLLRQQQQQQQQFSSNPQYTGSYFKAHDDSTVNQEIERLEQEISGYKEKETASSYIDGKYKFVAGDQTHNSTSSNSGNNNNTSLVKTANTKKITYKPYTLEQYKQIQPKEYMEIVPKLKPDLNTDELLTKRANLQRIKEFAKQLDSYNKSILTSEATKKQPTMSEAKEQEQAKKFQESKHLKRLEFAKNIPKPITTNTAIAATSDSKTSNNNRQSNDNYHKSSGSSSSSSPRIQQQQHSSPPNRNNNNTINRNMPSSVAYHGNNSENSYNNGYDDNNNNDDEYAGGNIKQTLNYQKPSKIEELENKHRQSKLQIEAIKKSLRI